MRLVLGTAQFGLAYGIANQSGQVTPKEVKSMLQLALANSMNMLDTAIAYGDSEMYLGQAGSESFRIITKLPPLPDSIIDVGSWIQQQVNASLSRLGVAKIYGLLLHRPDQLLSSNGVELYQGLQNLKDNGKVEKIGISIYSPSELDLLMSRYCFDLVQAPFNLVDQRLYSTGWLHRLKDSNVEIHTRSAFLQGLLLMSQAKIPNKFSAWNNLWCSWNSWLLAHNISAVQASLAFPLSFSEIDQVIVGADSASQLSQIISAAKWRADIRLPDLKCDDENLINPTNWNQL